MKKFTVLSLLLISPIFAATNIIHFTPFQWHHLKQPYILKQTFKNDKTVSCLDSALGNRTDVWRCFAQNGVYDPCFQQNENTVVCLKSPWDTEAIQIQVSLPFPQRTIISNPDLLPWALELQNKTQCTILMGATNGINGKRTNYYCSDKTYLYGNIDKTKPDWTIDQQLNRKSKRLTKAIISTVLT